MTPADRERLNRIKAQGTIWDADNKWLVSALEEAWKEIERIEQTRRYGWSRAQIEGDRLLAAEAALVRLRDKAQQFTFLQEDWLRDNTDMYLGTVIVKASDLHALAEELKPMEDPETATDFEASDAQANGLEQP